MITMAFRFPRVLCLAAILGAGWFGAPDVHAQNETALLEVWDRHMESLDDAAANIQRCREFLKANPTDQFVPVVRGIEAWHLFRSGKTEEALRLLEPYLEARQAPVDRAAEFFARSWLTRRDRDRVAAALQAYYRHEVEFPARLNAVPAHPKIARALHPPLQDRFGIAWRYNLVGIGKLKGFANQRYSLESTQLGEFSDFQKALQVPYGSGLPLTLAEVLSVPGQPPAVRFADEGRGLVVLIGLGLEADGVFLAHVGDQILVVCDSLHWKILPRN